jgi:hypothetical protein
MIEIIELGLIVLLCGFIAYLLSRIEKRTPND